MSSAQEYRFEIDAYTPDTLPMARLAEYMADLAALLGEVSSVHFVRLESGSTGLIHKVEEPAIPKVRARVNGVIRGDAPADAMNAYRKTNQRLKEDNSTAVLFENESAEIIRFPGREMVEPEPYGPFNNEGTLDGKVIMVGGVSDPVPVHLQQGDTVYNCHAKREIAGELGRYLFAFELRISGVGLWNRENNGAWTLHRFNIRSFDVLDDDPLSVVVTNLRAIPGSEWNQLTDPWAESMQLRHEDDGAV